MNPDRLLKAGMFGEAILEAGASVQAPMVPRDAAHEVDGRTVVFARLDEDLFEVRLVDVVDAGQGRIAITDGVEPDEPVAVAGGYMLKSEMLKARLGAGCGGH
jgi:cobalt-zinc-cadmium efflux system membrane fusion protein